VTEEPPTAVGYSRHHLFEAARQITGWSVEQLWMGYLAVGGSLVVFDLDAYLAGLMPMPSDQEDVLACALNERLADLGSPTRVPYRTALPTVPSEDAINALLKWPPNQDPTI
jgi:hypothetical protein